jgi:crossover junction endodeoxyribonuclease RusA
MRLVLLGLPPTTNNLYAVVNGRQVKSDAGRAWTGLVSAVAQRHWTVRPSRKPFAVMITYYRSAYDRDVDGSHKTLLDGLSGLVWRDDRQVMLLSIRKLRAPEGTLPWTSVVVRELEAEPSWRPLVSPADAYAFTSDFIPPSTNNTYAVVRGIRRKTREGRSASERYVSAMEELAGLDDPMTGRLRVRVRHAFRENRRDVDGSHKLLLDAARGVLWNDDLQIDTITLTKCRREEGPLISFDAWEVER